MTLNPGARLGPYEVTALIGQGGMGEVYRAHDPSLDRDIAIKVLPEELAAKPDMLRRFQREAKAVAALNHPNVVTIHAVEESDGVHFISMELVEGRPLGELIAKGPLRVERFFDVMTQLADALTAAHARGITHRDLKPANVMVTDDGRVKVLDFGLAKFVGTGGELEATRSTALTQGWLIVGTLPYMSPEQVERKPVDHRSDIFSLGVVMYEAVTGRRPFIGESVPALMSAILRDAPPSASDLRADLPASVARLIERCLEKSPGERYQGAAELLRELRAARKEHESGATVPAVSTSDEKSIAVLPFTNMSPDPENEFFADGITEDIINALGQIAGLRVAARTSAFSFKGKNVDLREVGEKLNVRTVLEGSVRKSGKRLRITAQLVNVADGYHIWSERYDRELEDVFEVQDEIARTIADRLKVTLSAGQASAIVKSATDNLQAYELYLKGRALLYKRGLYIPQAVECFKEAVALDAEYALAWAGLADAQSTLGYYGLVRPAEVIPQAKEAAVRAVQLDDGLAEAHGALAGALLFGFDVDGSEQEFRRALEINADFIQARNWYAVFVLALIRGRFDEALDHTAAMRGLDPLSAYVEANHAFVLYVAGRYDEAVETALAAVDRDPQSYIAHYFLSLAYQRSGRLAEAVAAGHGALAVSGRHSWAMASMTCTYAELGRTSDARGLYDEMVARTADRYVQASMPGLGAAALGLKDEAVAHAESAMQERDPLLLLAIKHLPIFEPLRQVLREAGKYDEFLSRLGLA